MRGSAFVFDYHQLLYYKCHKANPNCGGSYVHSPDWMKKILSVKNNNKCFHYAGIVL